MGEKQFRLHMNKLLQQSSYENHFTLFVDFTWNEMLVLISLPDTSHNFTLPAYI